MMHPCNLSYKVVCPSLQCLHRPSSKLVATSLSSVSVILLLFISTDSVCFSDGKGDILVTKPALEMPLAQSFILTMTALTQALSVSPET